MSRLRTPRRKPPRLERGDALRALFDAAHTYVETGRRIHDPGGLLELDKASTDLKKAAIDYAAANAAAVEASLRRASSPAPAADDPADWESIARARARAAALQFQGVPEQAIDEPEKPAEKHEAPDLDDLGMLRQDPHQEADDGDHQHPDGEHDATVAELTGRVELLEAMHLAGSAADAVCGDVFRTANTETAEAIELVCSLSPGHAGDHSDAAGRNAWSWSEAIVKGGDDVG